MAEPLGKTLRKIRESKNLSLEEVSERTRIPKKNIVTIEEDRLHEMQSIFYAKGFVKAYSQFLGALEQQSVKEYLSTGPKKDTPQLVLKGENAAGTWLIKRKKYIGLVLLVVFGAYALIFGLGQIGKFLKKASNEHRQRIAQKKEKKQKQAQVVEQVFEVKPRTESGRGLTSTSPVVSTAETKAEDIELAIEARYNTWIEVVGDGVLLFRGALEKGTRDVWRAKKEIKIDLGNAGGVTLCLNGKNLGSPGKKGKKKTITVTKDGIKKL